MIITLAHADMHTHDSLSPGEVLRVPDGLGIVTGEGILVINKLKPAGKPEMTAQAFLAGYGSKI